MLKRIQSFNYTPEEPPPLLFSSSYHSCSFSALFCLAPFLLLASTVSYLASLFVSVTSLHFLSPFSPHWPTRSPCPAFPFLIFNVALTQSSQNAEKLSDLHVLHKHNKIRSLKPLRGALWACTQLVLLGATHMQSAVPWHFWKMKPPQVIWWSFRMQILGYFQQAPFAVTCIAFYK